MPEEKKPEHKAHEEHKAEHSEHLEHVDHKKQEQNVWRYTTIALMVVVILLVVAFTIPWGSSQTAAKTILSPQQASTKAVSWITDYFSSTGANVTVTLINSTKTDNGVYEFTVNLSGAQGSSAETYYVSEDGSLFFPTYFQTNLTSKPSAQTQTQTQQAQSAPKTDTPVVDLFVMSYCPYGTQAEKGIIPVVNLLKSKISFTVRFVDYSMHGHQEIVENTVQYCIQKEQTSKYFTYLSCFLQSGNQSSCLTSAGIDQTKLNACTAAADTEFNITYNENNKGSSPYPAFDTDLALNQQYGVQGSPTLVINGVQVNSNRDPQSFLKAICAAFNNAPAECSQSLSTATPSTGFGGTATSGSTSNGGCATS